MPIDRAMIQRIMSDNAALMQRLAGGAPAYPQPTTDADEFVAGMEAVHDAPTVWRHEWLELCPREGGADLVINWQADGLVTLSPSDMRQLAALLLDAAGVVERSPSQHTEVLNEAMDEDERP